MTAKLELATGFVLAAPHRILRTNEPSPTPGPLFYLLRSATEVAWAVHVDVAPEIAAKLDALAASEPPSLDTDPIHAVRYAALGRVDGGPSFVFPDELPQSETVEITDEAVLNIHFKGWVAGEIAGGCAPVKAIVVDGAPVSVCFSARSGPTEAAAGVATAEAFRGRGLATQVTASWARAIRAGGRVPRYGTSWTNLASRGVARRLGLVMFARSYSIHR